VALNRWQHADSPPNEQWSIVVVGPGHNVDGCHYRELWGLTVAQHAYRFKWCTGTWERVGTMNVASIATGGGETWTLDTQGSAYRFEPADGAFHQVAGTLTRLAVGVDGVWGIQDHTLSNAGAAALAPTTVVNTGAVLSSQVFQYDAASGAMVQIPQAQLIDIAAGGSGVWGRDASQGIWRLQAPVRKFVAIPNATLRSLSVGSGTGVWGIDNAFQIRGFVNPARTINPVLAQP
jgi:hypothetical protein